MACAELEKACTASTRRAGQTAPEDVRPCIFVSQLHACSLCIHVCTGYRAEAQSHFSDEATRGELEACDSSLGSWGDPLPPSQPTADERGDLTFDDKRNACLEDYSMPTSTCTDDWHFAGRTAGAHERLREDGWRTPWRRRKKKKRKITPRYLAHPPQGACGKLNRPDGQLQRGGAWSASPQQDHFSHGYSSYPLAHSADWRKR